MVEVEEVEEEEVGAEAVAGTETMTAIEKSMTAPDTLLLKTKARTLI